MYIKDTIPGFHRGFLTERKEKERKKRKEKRGRKTERGRERKERVREGGRKGGSKKEKREMGLGSELYGSTSHLTDCCSN